jgi:hypothetical protein
MRSLQSMYKEDQRESQTNASGAFQEGHFYIWHIYFITAFDCPLSRVLEGRKNHNINETQ